MTLSRLERLAEVTAAARDAELAALASLSHRIDRLRSQLASLRTIQRTAEVCLPTAEALWDHGRTARLRQRNAELADLLARREVQVARSRRAFGRSRAAEELLGRAKAVRSAGVVRARGG